MKGIARAVACLMLAAPAAPGWAASDSLWVAAPESTPRVGHVSRALPDEMPVLAAEMPVLETERAPVVQETKATEELGSSAAELPAVDPQSVLARLVTQMKLDLMPYFHTFLYVSKAKEGPWAQQMFIFTKDAAGNLAFQESFPISTGRERQERYFTYTPSGFYQLDPGRLYRMVRSDKWDGAPMPFAMFFDYSYRTTKSGLALHAAHGRRGLAELGMRASGGCVRMPPEKAQALFESVTSAPPVQVPVFAFDAVGGTTNREGQVQRDAQGRILTKPGIGVLVFIDTYEGDAPQMASLH